MARGYLSEDAPARVRDECTVAIDGAKCLRESKRAIFVRALDQTFWVPQSVVHADSEVYRENDEGNLVLMQWWVRQQPWKRKAGLE
jgi:hypothetical protein